jgi:hypothetical protein
MTTIARLFSGGPLAAAAVIAASMGLGGIADAAPLVAFDANLASPGVYYGSGNINGGFVTADTTDIELGLRTIERYVAPIAPDGSSSTYDVKTGDATAPGHTGTDWGFVFSINTALSAASSFTLANITASLCVEDVGQGTTNCGNPLGITDNVLSPTSPTTGVQNSEALQFLNTTSPTDTRFFDLGFNIDADDTYIFTLSVSDLATGALLDSVQMTDIAGAGATVPEPSSIALFGAGLLGLGLILRRKAS